MLFWLALAIAVCSVVASLVYVTTKGLGAFRAFKQLNRSIGAGLDRIATATAEIERHLADAAEAGTRLDRSLARLRVSRTRLNVLRSAIDDVKASAGRLTAVYPRK
ncbi:MAG: hypothetical protein M3R12_08915 [Actinomycetota bacterium]|nr:hypothetical protein [Actinomycetota bacterium]